MYRLNCGPLLLIQRCHHSEQAYRYLKPVPRADRPDERLLQVGRPLCVDKIRELDQPGIPTLPLF